MELQFGHDFYLPGLHGSLFDVNFQWGNDGEFKGTIDEIEEYYNRDYSIPQRFVYAFDTVQKERITDEWRMNTKTQTDSPHFSFQE